ncbi:hypothetical protein A3Q56_04206 [Intoshia linei]|uniref:Uncharacterized protein n=1 Tax=Intoshia linei TaxID=1819745 RepID=A0A177B3R6_9BILA|nr:hypothetical protein A3Q56_04206 [Intoshia linei]
MPNFYHIRFSADERLNEMRKTSVLVDSGGNVLWIPQGMFKSTCAIDIKYFPFDTQICVLKFGSWSHDGRTLDLNFYQDLNSLDLNDFTRSNEWDIIGHSAIKNTKLYPCCVNPYIDITFTIKIKRKFTHFVYILLLPCILLSTLTMLMFWIPPESQHKMILGMNLFVAYFVLLMLLADHTPISSNSVPIIGIYFCLNMVLITLSNFLSIMVINLYLMNNVYFTYMPKFVETIFIKILGQYLCPSLLKTLHQYVAESFNARIKSEEASAIIFNKIRKKKVMETPPLKRKPFNKLKKVEKRCDTSFNSPLLESINDAWNFSTSLNTLKPKRYQTTNNKAGKSEYSSISLQNLATQKVENQHYPKKISQLNSHLKLNMDINPHHKNLTKRKASNMFSSKSSYDIQNNYNPKLISDIESPNINCIGKSRKLREQLLIKQIKEIKNAIINVVDNETRQSLNQKNIQVWRIVAIVLDRIFFISYFMIISVTTIIACILNELND